jgi:hypothetical protein
MQEQALRIDLFYDLQIRGSGRAGKPSATRGGHDEARHGSFLRANVVRRKK